MAEAYQNVDQVLDEARMAFRNAELGMEDYRKGDRQSRRVAGLRNAIVWGRAVTNVLQHIRTFDRKSFNEWYAPKQAELMANADFKYLYELRSQLLKEGTMGATSVSIYIEHLNVADLDWSDPPANAISRFVGDRFGGSGFTVRLADGTTENVYRELPESVRAKTETRFGAPTREKGLAPPAAPIETVLADYIGYLGGLVADAAARFGHR